MEDIHICEQTISNQTLVFDSKCIYFLGPELILQNCELIIKTAASNFLNCGVEFHNCTIVFKRKFAGMRWDKSKFFNCKFIGEFGGNIGNGILGVDYVCEIRDCDFSECILNGVRFIEVDMATIKLPRWPCVTIFNPYHHIQELNQVKGWGIYGSFFNPEDIQYFGPDTGLGLCISGNWGKKYNVDEKLLYEELSTLDFVYL